MPGKKKPIALISAVPFEARKLLRSLVSVEKLPDGVTTGMLGNSHVAHISSGPGIVNAAWAATMMIERFSPTALVVFGIGGAFHGSGLVPGDVAAAESETLAELGAITPGGFMAAEAMGLSTLTRGGRKHYSGFRLDRKLLRQARGSVKASGPFLTVSTVTGTRRRAAELLGRHRGALCENMEGAAAAGVCLRYGIPMLEIRGISNMVEDRDTEKWEKNLAAENCARALLGLFEGLRANPRNP